MYSKGKLNTDEYEVGDWIYVEHGPWTRGVKLDEPDLGQIEVRRVEPDAVLLMSKEKPEEA